jgi:flagellar hook protein FlgE
MSFRIALSGLNASSADLDVISNNIANVSTTGFKESRSEFADIFSSASLGAVSTAIGSGVNVSKVDQQFSQGNISFTDNGLDLAISGQGFFRLSDNGSTVYSRAGSFGIDRDGYVVNAKSQRLTAFLADNNGNITGALGDLQLNTADIAPRASSSIDVGVNLPATATPPVTAFNVNDPSTYNNSTSLTLYDSQGSSHLGTLYFVNTGPNAWDTHLFVDGTEATPAASGGLTFNTNGSLSTPAGGQVSYDALAIPGATDMTLTLDYASTTPTTQFGSNFGVNALSQDGYASGQLSGVDISSTGVIQARFTNGQSKTLGQVALANFPNPQGLRQLGDTSWAESFDSGAALVGQPGSASLGQIQSGALEGSNVDLTEQLVAMITAQRDFQANSQVIKTEDAITQTIINIR